MEKVLCRHSGLLYEAKVLDIPSMKDKGEDAKKGPDTTYLVHYTGWSAR